MVEKTTEAQQNKRFMRDGIRRIKEENSSKTPAQQFVEGQIAFDAAVTDAEFREFHEKEQQKENPYEDTPTEITLEALLGNVSMGDIMEGVDISGLDDLIGADYEMPEFLPDSDDIITDTDGEPDFVPDEEFEIIPSDKEMDALIEEEQKEFEEEEAKEAARKEEEEKAKAAAGNNSKAIEENTKKLPKNDFVAPKVNDSKMPQIIMGVIALVACIYLGLLSSTYYYNNYTLPVAKAMAEGGGFGDSKASKIVEPTTMQCLMGALEGGTTVPDLAHIQTKPFTQTTGMLLAVVTLVVIYSVTKRSSEKQMRVGEEHGSKHLATKADIKKYQAQFMEKDNYNQIYSKNTGLSLNNKKTNRSANVLVIGGTGTGKTFKYINPNILQENATQIITDPSGDLFNKFAPFLLNKGYNVFLFNVNDFNISSYYNPLLNVFDAFGNISEVKVDVLVDLYMKNAKAGKEASGGDPFWDKAEKAFLTAVIYYVLENDDIPKEDKCFHTVLEKVQKAKAENQGGKSAGETILTKEINSWKEKVAKTGRKIKTPIYYDTFLIAPEKTANTILITTAVDLQIFATEEVNRVTRYKGEYDNTNMYINFDDMAQTQSYLFLGIPQSHQAYNFLISMLYSQMYARLYELGERVLQGKYCLGYRPEIPQFNVFDSKEEMMDFADNVSEENIIEMPYINNTKIYYILYKGRFYKRSINRDVLVKLIKDLPTMVYKCNNNYPELPIHVNFLLDEFKNIGEIPNFLTILSTSRKYRIGSHVILQDIAQAQTIYKDKEYETLLANVDTTIFLGSILQADKEEIQKMLGKTTIRVRSQSTGQGMTPNYSYAPTEVDLVSISQLEQINQNGHDDCVVMVRDTPPVIDRKAYLTEHPKYEDFQNASKALKQAGYNLTQFYDNAQASGLTRI